MFISRLRGFGLLGLSLLLGALLAGPCLAQATGTEGYETLAREAILIDARTGQVLFEKNADTPMPPASLSKLMTMVMVFEALAAGKLDLNQEFTVSEDAWRRGGAMSGGSTMYAELKSKIRLEDLMKGVIVQSANDACIVIAENMAGSEARFADQMTERAHELGAATARFRNATGLPEEGHVMSARDLAVVARHIVTAFPAYYRYYSLPDFTWNSIRQQNRNPLLKDYAGADGMKTGYTREAGYGLVGSAMRDGRRLILVITGLTSINDRRQEAQRMLDWGFRQFRLIDVYEKGSLVGQARVWGGRQRRVDLQADAPVTVSLTAREQAMADITLVYRGPLLAPIRAGDPVGAVRFTVNGLTIAEVPVSAAGAVEAEPSMWRRALDSLLLMVLGS